MSTIAKNKTEFRVKCKICGKVQKDIDHLVSHIDNIHHSQIFPGFTAEQYEYYLRTGKKAGRCVVCGGETGWNKSTNKYHRICSDKCREEYREVFKQRMIGKHGKVHLLDDPEQQRKMIYAKRTSGQYDWLLDNDKVKKIPYASSYEKDFLEMLDTFLGFDGNDIIGPSPHNYVYTYNGKNHVYIPDYYIPSLNLEIEIKDGVGPNGNPNMHPKIQAVDKVKEKLKDEVMASNSKSINYIKVMNKDYSEFFSLILKLRSTETATGTGKENLSNSALMEASTVDHNITIDDVLSSIATDEDYKYLKLSLMKKIKSCHPYYLGVMKELLDAWIDKCRMIESNPMAYKGYYMVNVYQDFIEYIEYTLLPEIDRRAIQLDINLESVQLDGFTNVFNDGLGHQFKPVYILLTYTGTTMSKLIRMTTHQPYSHASISLDTSLKNMYTFGRKNKEDKLKFINEDIDEGLMKDLKDQTKYSLYMVLLTNEEHDRLSKLLDEFKKKKDTLKYNFAGLISLAFGKGQDREDRYFCSQFVGELLNEANSRIYSKNVNLLTPYDLVKNKSFIFLKKGLLKNYNKREIDSRIKDIIHERGLE